MERQAEARAGTLGGLRWNENGGLYHGTLA